MLPITHTCYFSIELPDYSTLEIMTERITFAMVLHSRLNVLCMHHKISDRQSGSLRSIARQLMPMVVAIKAS
jgi:hypothetical protein